MKSKSKSKFKLSSLLFNDKYLLIISFIIAFVLWMWVAIEQSPEIQKVVTKVPVTIKLENSVPEKLGLQVFGQSDFTIDITVTGKKYVVSSLEADDFIVVANTNNADSSGKKTLKLIVSAKDENPDFTITSYSENEIELFFDRYKQVELPVIVDVQSSVENIVPDEHKLGEAVPSVDRVTISGPSTYINQVESLKASVNIDEVLTKTTTKNADIVLLANDGSSVDKSLIDFSEDSLTVTLPVLKLVTLPTAVEFKNAPAYYTNNSISYNVYPSKVKAAVPVDLVETTKYYTVGVIDFSQIYDKNNNYKISAENSVSYEFLDENITSFTVNIDASDMISETFIVPSANISIKNNDASFVVNALNNSGKNITVVGSSDAISSLSGSDFYIVVDTAEQNVSVNTKTLKGRVVVPNNKQCWSVGECDIAVSVEQK